MDYRWNTSFRNIGLFFEPKIVRVKTDDRLKDFLSESKRAGARRLSVCARKMYGSLYGKELKISEKSLACEIYWHYYIWKKAVEYEQRHGAGRLTSWLIFHMDVIDCGEKDVDNNRFLWDLLALLF